MTTLKRWYDSPCPVLTICVPMIMDARFRAVLQQLGATPLGVIEVVDEATGLAPKNDYRFEVFCCKK